MLKESKWFEHRGKRLSPCLLQLFIVIVITTATAVAVVGTSGYDSYELENDTYFNQLVLEIYVDETGKALVTGYIEPGGVENLLLSDTSEYIYETDINQLYALTNGLTRKIGDNWALNFATSDYYTDYHTIFYLPGDVRLGEINCSSDMRYFVSASNGSFIIDVQGYDVENPMTTIEYQQPLKDSTGVHEEGTTDSDFGYLVLIIALAVLVLALGSVVVRMKRKDHFEDTAKVKEEKIEVTPGIKRVMETLTDREQAIVNALLKHNGEMTQADLRYETEIPKSSLTGILRTLERRKIIVKKEWGRTNIIALSNWFLSKTERD